ncbi:uncharacterized protein BDZ83DRAFT_611592 [Colletotrichum acutatum]|uniref:Uncharacterized protein n=1 Tax=Glomerella acutata TaxID=27357 RepID=A0AAD8URT6_GLOAC|nr:uncharacterized protein BDZ83DRAFT_611592 [Colletotrichum acutatum]KAK1727657.1 hypothetical protein BDZ83DRAFT_611592 [Colletotrichum acutatum]
MGRRMADHLQDNESDDLGPSLMTPPDSPLPPPPEPDATIVQINTTSSTPTSSPPPSPSSSSKLFRPSSPSSSSSSSETPTPVTTPPPTLTPTSSSTPLPNRTIPLPKWRWRTHCGTRYLISCTNRCVHCGRFFSNKPAPKTGPLSISRLYMRDKALLSLRPEDAEFGYFVTEHMKRRRNCGGPRAATARARAERSAMFMARAMLEDSVMASPPWLMLWPFKWEYVKQWQMGTYPARGTQVKPASGRRVRFSTPFIK